VSESELTSEIREVEVDNEAGPAATECYQGDAIQSTPQVPGLPLWSYTGGSIWGVLFI
jgi:hypothetical protein